jgi:hypothetical protein
MPTASERIWTLKECQKAALAYAEAIAWRLETDDAFWERMHRHFSKPELVELGCRRAQETRQTQPARPAPGARETTAWQPWGR